MITVGGTVVKPIRQFLGDNMDKKDVKKRAKQSKAYVKAKANLISKDERDSYNVKCISDAHGWYSKLTLNSDQTSSSVVLEDYDGDIVLSTEYGQINLPLYAMVDVFLAIHCYEKLVKKMQKVNLRDKVKLTNVKAYKVEKIK